jgi:hypothetical protein
MRRTPQYLLPFYQSGDIYRASDDLDRNVIVDNQLEQISSIVGDGVLLGWTVSLVGGLSLKVSPGSGFISSVVHRTLSQKSVSVIDNATSSIYMKSNIFASPGGFPVETEGPFSNLSSATFTDTAPPSIPTSFAASSTTFDVVNLFWDANTEADFDHYVVQRSPDGSLWTTIATPDSNGAFPNSPFQDTGLQGSTGYYYRIAAVDRSGNSSDITLPAAQALPYPVVTAFDNRTPADPTSLRLVPGNGQIAFVFEGSVTTDVTSHEIVVQRLNPDGSVSVTYDVIPLPVPTETYQLRTVTSGGPSLPIQNNVRYRVTVRSKRANGVTSGGTALVSMPIGLSAPLDITGLSAVSGAGSVTLSWTSSASATGSALGQKKDYYVRVTRGGVESSPIIVGLATSRLVDRYNATAAAGEGEVSTLDDDVEYVFRVTAVDSFGNESGGTLAKSTTTDLTPPTRPRAVIAEPGDESILVTWRHSTSEDAVDYKISYSVDNGITFSPEELTGFQESFELTGLANDVLHKVRLRTVDDAGNVSIVVFAFATPTPDVVPPEIPLFVQLNPGDRQVKVSWKPVPDEDLDHYVVRRQAIFEPIDTPPNRELTILSGSEVLIDVGAVANFVDIGLTNDQVYAYTVKAVDANGNESDFSANFLTAPTSGLNVGATRLDAPFALVATFGSGVITLAWNLTYPGQFESPPGFWNYPSGGPTDFNIYRSELPASGFQLLGSVPSSARTYVDDDLVSGTTYYYLVTAVRDNAVAISDTGAVQPANSILLAIVVAAGGSVASITHEQRVVEKLNATLSEETLSRLIEHRHSVKPQNSTTVEAIRLVPMSDVNSLAEVDLTALTGLSATALRYYTRMKGVAKANEFADGIAFVPDPTSVIGNPPFVGDFQIMIDSARPTTSFSISEDDDAVVFSSAVLPTATVLMDGLGFGFYVPFLAARRTVGEVGNIDVLASHPLDIMVDGESSPGAVFDVATQTIRFSAALPAAAVTAEVEPVVAEFGDQEGARRVNLSQGFILSDFTGETLKTYKSLSGAFSDEDVLFVLVNGERTTLGHFIDFASKSVVFDESLGLADVVSMEIQNEEEVAGELPPERVADVNASEFSSGKFLNAQLPEGLSHSGRVREPALPVFSGLDSSNGYVYSGTGVSMGSGTTAYSLSFLKVNGVNTLLLGTSAGILRASNSLFLSGDESVSENDTDASGLEFSEADDIVELARAAKIYSGRLTGLVNIKNALPGSNPDTPYPNSAYGNQLIVTMSMRNPSIVELDDGRVLLCGGLLALFSDAGISETNRATIASLIYDPATGEWTNTGYMNFFRHQHAMLLLPNGNVMVIGGQQTDEADFPPRFFAILSYRESRSDVEIFSPGSMTWTALPATMSGARHAHSATLLDPSNPNGKILVAGGVKDTPTTFTLEQLSHGVLGNIIYKIWKNDHVGLSSSELFDPLTGTWEDTGPLSKPMAGHTAIEDGGVVLAETTDRAELYDPATGKWTPAAPPPGAIAAKDVLDGPVKQFLNDSDGIMWVVTRAGVFVSQDSGRSFGQTKGLEAARVVHRIAEAQDKTMFAATDLGVYAITTDIKSKLTWFQGGLIGAGTTETFDLQPFGADMLAATEIGVFSSSDDGETWSQLLGAQDVRSIELAGQSVFAIASQEVLRSDDSGATWSRTGPFSFIDDGSLFLSRGQELFVGSSSGLFRSADMGDSFSLIRFDHNKDRRRNNVHMLERFGDDVAVGYDNVAFTMDAELNLIRLAEFSGIVPTVRVNGEEVRNGFRYDTINNEVTFEDKRFADDSVDAAVSYSLYDLAGGGWYAQNPNASITVYVNGREDTAVRYDAWLGRVAFDEPLSKFDEVKVTIIGTTLRNEGEHLHEELEDAMEREKGLPLSLGRDHACNLLQLGLSVEHNFWERGIERDQYYCLAAAEVDRSFNAFLSNAEFFIMGRRDYDAFNSTIDYSVESEQTSIGTSALVTLCVLEVSPTELWVGTDSGVFVLDPLNPMAPFSVSMTLRFGNADDNAVRDLKSALGDVYAVTRDGLFSIVDTGMGLEISKNAGHGLPDDLFAIASMHNVLAVGTDDGVYYSDSKADPPYEVWSKGSFTAFDGQTEIEVNGKCTAIMEREGTLFACVDNAVYSSDDGRVWRLVFTFADEGVTTNAMGFFSEKLFLATNLGVYDDNSTARSGEVTFRLSQLEGADDAANKDIHANDVFAGIDSLYVAGNFEYLYRKQNEQWTKIPVAGVRSVHRFIITSGGQKVALSNNLVLVE